MASTTITGNLAGDPELRYTAQQRPVANLTVMENRRRRDASGQWVDADPLPMRVTVWGEMAEQVASSLTKGTRVTVSGDLTPETWETKEGEKRRSITLVAEDVAASLRFATVAVTKVARQSGAHADGPPSVEPPF